MELYPDSAHYPVDYSPHDFGGWSLEQDGTLLEDNHSFTPTEDCTVYAVWTCHAIFRADGGRFPNGDLSVRADADRNNRVLVPEEIPAADDETKVFDGWCREGSTNKITVDQDGKTSINYNVTFVPVWKDKPQDDPDENTWTVIFDANGGTFPDGKTQISVKVEKGDCIDFSFQTPKADDETLIFTGWSLPDGSFIAKDELKSFVPEDDTTLTAVWRKPAESLELSERALTLNKGETAVLKASVLPEDATDKSVSWKSSNTTIATVDAEGNVKAVAKGTATITATAKDGTGISASCTVTVKQPVTKITLNKTTLSLMKGKTTTLTATASPDSANNKAVTWKSSNTKIATVDTNGLVKAVAKGTATITATAKDGSGVSASCTVTVKQPVTKITLNKTALSLMKGKTFTLTATASPDSANNKAVTWKSSNTKIATVDTKGLVKAVAKGTATITATAKDGSGVSASCKVTVKQPVTKITLNKTALSLMKGKTNTLTATAAPASANNKAVTWKSSNTKIATVDTNGLVKAVAKGTATITATAKDGSGVSASCKVTVKQPVTKITLNKTALTLNRGKTFTLKATAGPASANNKAVKWTTSNKEVATVTSTGVVKGIKRGTATITAAAKDGSGVKAVCKVTVRQLVTGLKISKTALTVMKGKTATLKVTVSPSNANNKTLKWTTSNKAVATVTSAGVMKGIKKGTATITATTTDGSKKTVTCKITVK